MANCSSSPQGLEVCSPPAPQRPGVVAPTPRGLEVSTPPPKAWISAAPPMAPRSVAPQRFARRGGLAFIASRGPIIEEVIEEGELVPYRPIPPTIPTLPTTAQAQAEGCRQEDAEVNEVKDRCSNIFRKPREAAGNACHDADAFSDHEADA